MYSNNRHPAAANYRSTRRRFTLIELLVVVAIIAIIAAILLPALGQAKYRTRLLVCTNTMRQMSLGLSMYVGDYNGYYPYREISFSDVARPGKMTDPTGGGIDDRPVISEAYDLQLGLCPFNRNSEIDVKGSTSGTVTSSYEHYFGSRIKSAKPEHCIMRDIDTAQYNLRKFNVILADMDWRYSSYGSYQTSHPDRAGLLPALARQDSDRTQAYHGARVTVRGKIDRNFAFTDGSIQLYKSLVMEDPRLYRIPAEAGNPTAANWCYIPFSKDKP